MEVSNSPSLESNESIEELVYDTVCVGQEMRTNVYCYQGNRQDWTLAEDSDSDSDNLDNDADIDTVGDPDPAMDQLAEAMAQLAQAQIQLTENLARGPGPRRDVMAPWKDTDDIEAYRALLNMVWFEKTKTLRSGRGSSHLCCLAMP